MKSLIVLPLLLSFTTAFCQNDLKVDRTAIKAMDQLFHLSTGSRLITDKYAGIKSGSPYFSEEWKNAVVKITDSTSAKNVPVRLDLLDGTLEFRNEKNEELICNTPVSAVELPDAVSGKNVVFIPSASITKTGKGTWYQVLFKGEKISLFKERHKEISETKSYTSLTTEKEIRTVERYLVLVNGQVTKVKKFSDIIDLSGNKAEALNKYIEQNKLSVRKESDIIALIAYYNSLT